MLCRSRSLKEPVAQASGLKTTESGGMSESCSLRLPRPSVFPLPQLHFESSALYESMSFSFSFGALGVRAQGLGT